MKAFDYMLRQHSAWQNLMDLQDEQHSVMTKQTIEHTRQKYVILNAANYRYFVKMTKSPRPATARAIKAINQHNYRYYVG